MNELKEQILEITDEYGELHRDYCALNNEDGADDGCDCLMEDLVDDLMQLIETYTAQKELEARIDELKRIDDEHQTTSQDLERLQDGFTQTCIPCEPIWERITQLSSQLTNNKEGIEK